MGDNDDCINGMKTIPADLFFVRVVLLAACFFSASCKNYRKNLIKKNVFHTLHINSPLMCRIILLHRSWSLKMKCC